MKWFSFCFFFFFQAEDGIRDRSPSRGLGDVYKRQSLDLPRTTNVRAESTSVFVTRESFVIVAALK